MAQLNDFPKYRSIPLIWNKPKREHPFFSITSLVARANLVNMNPSSYVQVSENLLSIYLDEYEETPWDALKYLVGTWCRFYLYYCVVSS